MSYVVRRFEQERGGDLLGAWSINAVDDKRNERPLVAVRPEECPSLNASSELVYVEGRRGSACNNSGFFVDGQRGFIPCNLG
jgi:hypothetical protein